MNTIQEVREIIIVAMEGEDINRLKTDATKWGEITEILQEKYDLRNLEAVVSTNKNTLTHPDAALPTGPFRLFLRQKDSKGGSEYDSMSFMELRNLLTDELKELFSRTYGVNWTNASKSSLISFFNSLNEVSVEEEEEYVEEFETQDSDEPSIIADFESLTNKTSFVDSVEKSKTILVNAKSKLLSSGTDTTDFIDETVFRLEEAIEKVQEVLNCINSYNDTSALDTISEEEKAELKRAFKELGK